MNQLVKWKAYTGKTQNDPPDKEIYQSIPIVSSETTPNSVEISTKIVEYNKELDYIDLKYNCFNNDIGDNDKSNVFKKIYKNMCQFNMYVALIISIVAFISLVGTFTIFLFYISYMNLSEIIYNSKLFL